MALTPTLNSQTLSGAVAKIGDPNFLFFTKATGGTLNDIEKRMYNANYFVLEIDGSGVPIAAYQRKFNDALLSVA